MLYLDSILFTMLRNCGFEKLREALCFDMDESSSSPRALSPRKGPAAWPQTERRARLDRRRVTCRNSARVSPQAGHHLPRAFRSLPLDFARTAFELQQASVAGRRALSSASSGLLASSSAPAQDHAPSRLTREHVLTRGVATPP